MISAKSRLTSLLASFVMVLALSLSAAAQQVPSVAPAPKIVPLTHEETIKKAMEYDGEDWRNLSLSTSHLREAEPLLGERDLKATFTRELYQVKWRGGDPIDLYVIRPNNVARPPAVLYLYGYPSETDRFRNDDYCERVTHGGFAAIGFVSALTGHRYHTRPMKDWFVSELDESLVTSVHDVQMILNYLATRGDIDMDHIGMLAQGSGATIAILAASVDSRIKAVDLLDPWADWPNWLAKSAVVPDQERPNYLKPEFLQRVAPFEPIKALPELKSQKVRIQHVADDGDTPLAAKKALEAATPQDAQIDRYETASEFANAVGGGRFFDWIKSQLRPSSKPVAQASSVSK